MPAALGLGTGASPGVDNDTGGGGFAAAGLAALGAAVGGAADALLSGVLGAGKAPVGALWSEFRCLTFILIGAVAGLGNVSGCSQSYQVSSGLNVGCRPSGVAKNAE